MKYFLLLLFFICFCSPKQPEDFYKFIKQFYNDTTYQLSRIEFPIDVKEISDEIENDSGAIIHTYTKDTWEFRSREDSDTINYKIWYTVYDIIATDSMGFKKPSGLMIAKEYKLLKNKWYLVRVVDCLM